MTAPPARRDKHRPDPAPVAAPSRVRSKRQQQIVQMVEGYDSTVTSSVMLRNVFLVWTLYGAALIIFGILALSADALDGSAPRAVRSLSRLP